MASLTPRHQNRQHEPNVDVATAGAEKTGGGCSKYSAKAMESGEFSNFWKARSFPLRPARPGAPCPARRVRRLGARNGNSLHVVEIFAGQKCA
jgi:hypothetical protein